MFSRSQSCRGNSQEPRSLDSGAAGNQGVEAYRQRLRKGATSQRAVTKVNVDVASKVKKSEG
jgi:hypothetical protein